MLGVMTQIVQKPKPVTDVFADCKSKSTRTKYPKRLKKFFEYLQLPGVDADEQGQAFLDNARRDPDYANRTIREYILENRRRVDAGEITAGTLKALFTPIKMFCDGYDDVTASVNWKHIKKGMPTPEQYSDDRAPTVEEIKKLLEYPDRRIKPIVLIMLSSGMRIGSFDGLQWKHIKPITNAKDEVIAARLQVVKSKQGPYRTFITPEAYHEIVKYMEFRKMWGEKISDDSWVLRNDFKTADIKRRKRPPSSEEEDDRGGLNGRAERPRQLKVSGINRVLVRALYEEGLRETLEEGEKRHEWKSAHGFRKFFETTVSYAGMHGLTFEMLMGHKTGLTANYMRPTEDMLLQEYVKVVPALTISEELAQRKNVAVLKQQQEDLEQRYQEKFEEMKGKQQELENRLKTTEMMSQEAIKAKDLLLHIREGEQKMLIRYPEMRKIFQRADKEQQAQEEYLAELHDVGAEEVDPEMEAEFRTPHDEIDEKEKKNKRGEKEKEEQRRGEEQEEQLDSRKHVV
jgi:Phage integrase family